MELLKYCAEGKNERFGVIEFARGADVTESFRLPVREVAETDWHRLFRVVDGKLEETGRQWAEVCFVPSWVCHKKHGAVYRYLPIREPLEQQSLPCVEEQISLPFPIMKWGAVKYKVTGIVTNRDIPGDKLICWYRGRCGKSEEAHSIVESRGARHIHHDKS